MLSIAQRSRSHSGAKSLTPHFHPRFRRLLLPGWGVPVREYKVRGVPPGALLAIHKRAQGGSYEACAAAAGWTVAQLHTWIHNHRIRWYRELFRARHDIRDAACDEAVTALRTQLRVGKKDELIRAASSLASNFRGKRSGGGKLRIVKPKSEPEQVRQMVEAIPEGVITRVHLHLQAGEEEVERSNAQPRPASPE